MDLTVAEQIQMYHILDKPYDEVVRLYMGAERLYELKKNRQRYKTVNFFRKAIVLKYNEEIEIDRQNQIENDGWIWSCLPPNHLPLSLPSKRPKKDYEYVKRFRAHIEAERRNP